MSRYRPTGGVKIKDGRGWHKKDNALSGLVSVHLCIFAFRNRFILAVELRDTFRSAMGIKLSKSVIHKRFHGVGLKARSPFTGMHLTRAHKRLQEISGNNVIYVCKITGDTSCSPMNHDSV